MTQRNNDELLKRYVAAFAHFDDMVVFSDQSVDSSMIVGEEDGWRKWQPIRVQTLRTALDELYTQLQGRLPPLYERLISSYRWAQVEAGSHCLLANLPGEGFSGLLNQIQGDAGLWEALAPAGFIQFARAPGGNYDPICFDVRHRKQNAERRVVRIDHEQILCNFKIKEVAELAPTFRDLILQTIEAAKTVPSRAATT